MATFHHSRLLSTHSIRLISLIPSNEFQDPLEVTLSQVRLDDVSNEINSYEALSYVWGARNGSEPIQCDDNVLLVTPNCESALRHLRLNDTARTLWIDAICIDQEDNPASTKERNAQVALMGKIYQKAALTLCWLGEGNGYTHELIAHLNRIGNCPSQRGLKRFMLFDEKLREEGRMDFDSSALNQILSHPWHARIWTVQEAAYPQDCQIMCGDSTISWDNYASAVKYLVSKVWIDGLDEQTHKSCVSIDMRDGVRKFLRAAASTQPNADLSIEDKEEEQNRTVTFLTSYLADINQLQATNPKDKIYGMQALYTDLGIPLPAVDYTKSLCQVYQEATIAMIAWSGTLKVLGDAYHSQRDTPFPSWVPDWSDADLRIYTPHGDATGGSRIAHATPTALNPTPGELHIRGKFIGTVLAWRKSRTCTAMFPSYSEHCELQLTGSIDDLGEDPDTLAATSLAIERVRFFRQLYRLLQKDTELCPYGSEDMFAELLLQSSYVELDEAFKVWLDILLYPNTTYDLIIGEMLVERWKTASKSQTAGWTQELTECAVVMASLLSRTIRDHHARDIDTPQILNQVAEFTMRLNDKTLILAYLNCPRHDNDTGEKLPSKATVLRTTSQAAIAGDSIVLLEGGEWPVVLRPLDERWQFIGPAYITDTMDGEAWVDENGQVDELSNFVLI